MLQWVLLGLVGAGMGASGVRADQRRNLVDFSEENEGVTMGITDDGVMGGLSKGAIRRTDEGSVVFSGTLSLENNGGFSSLRMAGGEWNLEGWKGIVLKVRGDGRTYDLRLTTNEHHRGSAVSFRGSFQTRKGEWVEAKIPFSELEAGWRGRTLDTKFDPARIEGLGIILADKQPGSFHLEVQWMKGWK